MLIGYLRVCSVSACQSKNLQRDTWLTAGVDTRHDKTAVCLAWGIPRSTLNDTLVRTSWSVQCA